MTTLDSLLAGHPEEFADRVRRRLADERVVWFTTVSDSGVAQPNPVWFHWDGEAFVVHNDRSSARVANLTARPRVTLHFDGGPLGRDVVVFQGTAEVHPEPTATALSQAYLDKYRQAIDTVLGGVAAFERSHPTVVRIRPTRLRGR
ncbi:hypothetical protein GCM10011609_06530 [Lentzea pudingi]|uniref:Pyridoxamine 5'-phosphate oxidase N-terminal domain-containing protein n=1 Tax=Lentzea pudingi TaxID=1789439 RepID=A0ABQ2HAP3_9PSEU|nr:pyridoxamine 5'-phosphate oxidase family protein [Lentzea pudingi]GGM73432.1 hypothetical protein GCM10011609_06530 [Lentzea pudingi]